MGLTVQYFIDDAKRLLKNWVRDYNQVKDGTYKYDNSMSKECTDSMIENKITTYMNVIKYLETLPRDKVLHESRIGGYGEEYAEYLRLVNGGN